MPRELDPEWMWRARLWAASWKGVLLIVAGLLLGVVWLTLGGNPLMEFLFTGFYLALVGAWFWFRA